MNCVNHPDTDAPYQCHRCQNFICVECETKMNGRSVCPKCLARIRERLAAQYEAETRHVNYGGAVLGGILAAVATACAWSQLALVVKSRLDVGALVLGGMVGWGVIKGAGDKRGRILQQTACILTLAGIIFGYFLVFFRTERAAYLHLSGAESAMLGAMYAFPGYLSSIGLLGWLFLAAGTVLSYYIPRPRSLTSG